MHESYFMNWRRLKGASLNEVPLSRMVRDLSSVAFLSFRIRGDESVRPVISSGSSSHGVKFGRQLPYQVIDLRAARNERPSACAAMPPPGLLPSDSDSCPVIRSSPVCWSEGYAARSARGVPNGLVTS